MISESVKISSNWADIYHSQNNRFTMSQLVEILGVAQVWGYGVYSHRVEEKDGEYHLVYMTSTSCD